MTASAKAPFCELLQARTPVVVGAITGKQMLHGFAAQVRPGLCDVIELRLDLIGLDQPWQHSAQAIEEAGIPTFLTARLIVEGGKYSRDDQERVNLLHHALNLISGIDVEWRSQYVGELCAEAKTLGKTAIVSYHDFLRTPPREELVRVIHSAAECATVVKISTMAVTADDIETLASLLREDCGKPLCVIAMGELGTPSRVSFPLQGSALTYGYIDGSAAPGQMPASQLVRALRAQSAPYDARHRLNEQPSGTSHAQSSTAGVP